MRTQQVQTSFTPVLSMSGVLQRKCDCGNHMVAGGECSDCAKKKNVIQRKLAVGASNDHFEQEADRIADQVLAAPAHHSVNATAPRIQRYATQATGQTDVVPGSVDQVLSGSGRPLEPGLRRDMEQRFVHDFSRVRVHSGTAAEQSARELNARAYTVGHNIVFGAGCFAPGTQQGRHLIAHELTHVVQQSAGLSSTIQRQPDEEQQGEQGEQAGVPSKDFGKELEKESVFQELEKAARDKIKQEIKDAPKTITKAIFDRIVDLAPIDEQAKTGLKKVGEAIIKVITDQKSPSTSTCDAVPGWHEGQASDHKGMCCQGSNERHQDCCPKDRFASANDGPKCCAADEFVNAEKKCEKFGPVDVRNLCISPAVPDKLGRCCKPPLTVIDGVCTVRVPPPPPPQPFTLSFKVGVIDDYNIDESVLNSRQKPHFEKVKKQIHEFMETCPSSIITIVGFADKPGTEEHNSGLGQRRADHIKFLLQLDLIKINFRGMPPVIFARSEGEANPVDPAAGEKFSAKNRRIEIEFNSICPPLGSPSLTKPLLDTPLRMGFRSNS